MRRTSGAAAATAARRRWPAASKGRRLPRAGTTRLRPSSLPPPGPPGPPCVFLFLFPPSPPPHLRWLGPLVNETSISLRPTAHRARLSTHRSHPQRSWKTYLAKHRAKGKQFQYDIDTHYDIHPFHTFVVHAQRPMRDGSDARWYCASVRRETIYSLKPDVRVEALD